MIKTVLITGGGGFIGSHLVELLLEKKYKVVILDRSKEGIKRLEQFIPKLKIYYSNSDALKKIFIENKIDCVIHLAARYIKRHTTVKDVEEIIETNIKFPSVLLELCSEYKVKYFINTGTFFEYKPSSHRLTENSPRESFNLYAASKSAFKNILELYAKDKKMNVIDFHLFAPFGDRDNEKLMALLVKTLVTGEELDFSGGEQRWNFTYVKDIALAYLSALQNFDKIEGHEVFNVGYDQAVSIKEIASRLEKISGKKLKINWGANQYAEDEIFHASCDNTKIKSILQWKPVYNLDYGLEKTYIYYSKLYGA